jgi:hypothetical protein
LVAVDLENLVGCSPVRATPEMYADALAAAVGLVPLRPDDLMMIATNPGLVFVARDVAPSARLLTGRGPDGADRRLIEELSIPHEIARRFAEVVVASGDGAFVDAVSALNEAGLRTTVIAVPGQLSRGLRLTAHTVVWLPTPSRSPEAA